MIKLHKKLRNWKKRIDNHYKCFYNVVVRVNTYAHSAQKLVGQSGHKV